MKIPQEFRFLLDACRFDRDIHPSMQDYEAINLQLAAEIAGKNGLSALFYRFLKRSGSVPAEILCRLKADYENNLTKQILWWEELGRIIEKFRSSGIRVVPLKGIVLMETLYPEPGMRPLEDIDILVRSSDMMRSAGLLCETGYTAVLPEQISWMANNSLAIPLRREGFYVELHGDLINNRSYASTVNLDMEKIWANTRKITVSGSELTSLSPEDFLIHLCLHLSVMHGLSGLFWHLEICEFLNKEKIRWEVFRTRAKEFKIEKAVYLPLYFQQELFGKSSVPEIDCQAGRFEKKIWEGNILKPKGRFDLLSVWFLLERRRIKTLAGAFFSCRGLSLLKGAVHSVKLLADFLASLASVFKSGSKE